MLVPQMLLETLEDLSGSDFDKFKWFLGLRVLKSCEIIPKCDLESPHRYFTVSKMVETYGEETAVKMTVAILRLMKHHKAAVELEETHRGGAAAHRIVSRSPSTYSSASGRTISADGAAGAIALRAPTDIRSTATINPGRNVGGDIHSIISRLLDGDFGRKFHGSVLTARVNGLSSNFTGIVKGDVNGNIGTNFCGFVRGNVWGDVGSNFRGVIEGKVCGSVSTNFEGIIVGDIEGDVDSNFNGILMGNVLGKVGSNFCGVVEGNIGYYIRKIFMR